MLAVLFLLLACASARALTWTELVPEGGPVPAPRMRAGAAYDPAGRRLVVVGGRISGRELNDVWAFDPDSRQWTEITPSSGPAPAPRSTHDVVYDAANRRLLVWSGRQGNTFFNDVWAFDLDRRVWSEFAPAPPVPNVRYGTASVFDPVAGHLVTFAGFTDQGRFEDTWRFDPATSSWEEVSPAEGNPGRRCLHAASYDRRGRRMIVYGGQRGEGALGDVWAFDLTADTWSELTPTESPPGRFFAASEYDSRSHRLLVFGGNRGADDKTDEVWSFDLSRRLWERLAAAGIPPAARDGAVAAYVESEARLLIFGGAAVEGLFNDVWALDGLTPPGPTAVERAGDRPAIFALHPNAPNPFNPSTTIRYELGQSVSVELKIYDLLGREVRSLVHRSQHAGAHAIVWDGRDAGGRPAGSGAYLCRLQAGGFAETRKLLLVR